jgi:multimeric flavodoxin WrbA
MHALVLDGSLAAGGTGERVRHAVETRLAAAGWTSEVVTLRERRIGNCAGDLFCWIRSPGQCNTDDDNRAIAAATVRSDLLVFLTPVTFGGYASELKKALDHQIQILKPGFTRIAGETHHQKRYARYPDVLAVGWLDRPDEAAEALFASLVGRYALNFHAAASSARVAYSGMTEDAIQGLVADGLGDIAHRQCRALTVPPAPASDPGDGIGSAPRRAVLLVGSPRTRSSTSASLGAYLAGRLEERGVEVETIQLYPVAGAPLRLERALDVVEAADLVVLAAPLYVDTLPAPVIRVLERLAARRATQAAVVSAGPGAAATRRATFTAIVNCGFPEAAHIAPALAVSAQFAAAAGFTWVGGLALGGGQGLVHGLPLDTVGLAGHVRAALDLAADALARGDAIPAAAHQHLARPFVPARVYRAIGGIGWRMQARRWGVARTLDRRPYAVEAGSAGRQETPTG